MRCGRTRTACSRTARRSSSNRRSARRSSRYSPDARVTAQTPPAFIYHTTDDDVVPVEASVAFYRAMAKAGVPVEMHLFAKGRHGSGLGLGDPALDQWSGLLETWLRSRGLLPR